MHSIKLDSKTAVVRADLFSTITPERD